MRRVVRSNKYFVGKKGAASVTVRIFLIFLLVFAIAFFLWSIMRYNEIQENKAEREKHIARLSDDIDRLEYLVEAPLDDAYKIRVAREKLGMCFPDEIIYHTNLD